MATLTFESPARLVTNPRVILWLAGFGALTALLVLLTLAIKDSDPSQDRTVLDWVTGQDVAGLAGFTKFISGLTGNFPALGFGIAAIIFLWLVGLRRAALGFAIVGAIVGVVAFVGDLALGEIVDRPRPAEEAEGTSYPSGHTFGSTIFFGFWAFLGVHYGLKRKILIPVLTVLIALVLAVGFSRIHQGAHWPSDVAAGYLLGGMWLLILIPLFLYVQRASWLVRQKEDLSVRACLGLREERSIASRVFLDPERGTATKIYRPPGLVRLLYWVAFQASFPYEANRAALQTAEHRRKIASFLTTHRFGKDLVAHVATETCYHGDYSFVTEYVAGDAVENDDEAKRFLGQVAETFAEAGLAVWQVNPRNPHAHTNLIRNSDGDFVIIDLESAVVTPIPAPGQWRSALRRGSLPIFDDIDFSRLREYIATNSAALEVSLGQEGLAEFKEVVDRGEEALLLWQEAEPRIWGHLIRGTYRLLNWKPFFEHLMVQRRRR